jgi:hypothetical protein
MAIQTHTNAVNIATAATVLLNHVVKKSFDISKSITKRVAVAPKANPKNKKPKIVITSPLLLLG